VKPALVAQTEGVVARGVFDAPVCTPASSPASPRLCGPPPSRVGEAQAALLSKLQSIQPTGARADDEKRGIKIVVLVRESR
jgi:hypothetical protein